jgi:hypothetical protein
VCLCSDRPFSRDEIVDRCVLVMVNEAAFILDEVRFLSKLSTALSRLPACD